MSSNQRLIVAVLLSFVFFVGYSALFPPVVETQNDLNGSKKSQSVSIKEGITQGYHDATVAQESTSHATQTPLPQDRSNNLVHIDAPDFTLELDTLGRISSKILKDKKYADDAGNLEELISSEGVKPLHLRFSDATLDAEALKTPYTASVTTIDLNKNAQANVTLTQKLSGVTVTKALTFYADGHYDVTMKLSNDRRYFIYLGQRPEAKKEQMMTVKGALVYDGEGITTVFEDEDVEGRATFSNVQLISAFGQYFASIVYNLEHDVNVIVDRDRDSNPIVYFDAKSMMTFSGYLGPKEYATLKGIDPVLTNAIEYGFFTFISAPMFTVLFWLHGIFGNWGWSIIALTAIIRLLMFPLTFKGMMSMQRMKEIAPRVKEVQAKYKGDPQRMNAAVMELYKKHNANPLGGCLPMILQIPVFFAIYRVLLNAVELQGASWLVWSDLSRMDPWFVLPILMGATMFYQQHITPNNFTDPMQAKVFKWLPVVFTFFFITFPAGLVLYWLVNNIFSILQQYIVNVRFEAAKAERHEQHLAEKHHDKN
jgi:YidC/Oxa1 family membrane protein insertase